MNTVRLAAAGAGKTWKICNEALRVSAELNKKRILMVTYTNRGVDAIKEELEKQSNGIIPPNIVVLSWYRFLLRELIRPYQTYIGDVNEIRTIIYSLEHVRNYEKVGAKRRYITANNDVRSEEASNLVLLLNQKSNGLVFSRLEKIYSDIFFDEIQDLAGRDICILEELFASKINVTCVGDNKQSTFSTHTTRTNKSKTGRNIFEFLDCLEKKSIITMETQLSSWRFNKCICAFANSVYPNDNNMTTIMDENTEHDGVFIISKKDAEKYYNHFHPKELRYDKNNKNTISQMAINYGECKGKTYDRCMIYPTKPLVDFLKGKSINSPEKYYVAVTRARYSNAIVVENLFGAQNFSKCKIKIGDEEIEVEKFNLEDK